jgi:putative two-component system response regulator
MILVVDDDEMVRSMLGRILARHGYECRLVEGALRAREVLEDEDFELVLSDVLMPDESGIGLLRHVREARPHLPIVMVSGVNDPDLARTALELGAYGYVTKPFHANQVVIAVDNALRRAQVEAENREYRERLEWMVTDRTVELAEALRTVELTEETLRRASEETIQALSQAIEGRDIETGQHIARMSRYAGLLAELAGLDHEHCDLIRLASPMHDVGKIGVADGILFKPGKLTPAEFDVIKQHTEAGYSMLAKSDQPLLQLAATIARTHHERWDGAGYFQGLAGEGIPLEGRITAIADVLDALLTRRVYKSAYPFERSVEIIREGRGSQFDPELVDLFCAHLDDFAVVHASFPDPGS